MPLRWMLLLWCGWSAASAQPVSVTLKNIRHEFQALNNCAPVTAITLLGYYGTQVTQAQAANAMKDYPGDPQVTSLELAGYLGRAGLRSVIRYAGDAELVRALVARGFPVVLQQRLQTGSNVAHFRTVYGYSKGQFLISDPLLGPSLRLSTAQLMALWQYYNGEYLVAYPPAREAEVRQILGADFSAAANWQHLRQHGEQDVKARPNDPYAWWGLAKAQLRLGDVRAATESFDRAVRLGVPTVYFLYRQEAFEAWTQAGQHQKTVDVTQRALRAYPNSKELTGFYDLASAALRKATVPRSTTGVNGWHPISSD
ncbi:C39 family peptidase [Deinococcus deserti]|uniref:Putative peptidase C39A n=1 Tax=Deinococcus deserti (strain DSM 17065 / CIP 109153 / LMG 22923 / VCD115) TaxID=546414 RepID=C1D357_DEIDV|nr:C39 family peptidase [Deinococcus deserti]ACO47846.1 putative peptidase C39A, precursor [Deinococcus deserti VCD115]